MIIEHNDLILWPNGMGETPCSTEYAVTLAQRDAIYDCGADGRSLSDLSPAEYEEWMSLDHKLECFIWPATPASPLVTEETRCCAVTKGRSQRDFRLTPERFADYCCCKPEEYRSV